MFALLGVNSILCICELLLPILSMRLFVVLTCSFTGSLPTFLIWFAGYADFCSYIYSCNFNYSTSFLSSLFSSVSLLFSSMTLKWSLRILSLFLNTYWHLILTFSSLLSWMFCKSVTFKNLKWAPSSSSWSQMSWLKYTHDLISGAGVF